MSDYKLTIERVDNGYVLEFPITYEDDEETPTVRREVIAEDESQWGNLGAGQLLIYRIMEFFDLTGSKHDARRLRVSIEDKEGEEDPEKEKA